jgi:hypothetical protein
MKNVVFWDIKPQFVLRRRHITSPLQSPARCCYVKLAVFTAVTVKNANLWDVTPCGCSETYVLTRPTRRHIPEDGILPTGRPLAG